MHVQVERSVGGKSEIFFFCMLTRGSKQILPCTSANQSITFQVVSVIKPREDKYILNFISDNDITALLEN
jgi:hypothetical protein